VLSRYLEVGGEIFKVADEKWCKILHLSTDISWPHFPLFIKVNFFRQHLKLNLAKISEYTEFLFTKFFFSMKTQTQTDILPKSKYYI